MQFLLITNQPRKSQVVVNRSRIGSLEKRSKNLTTSIKGQYLITIWNFQVSPIIFNWITVEKQNQK